MGDILLTKIERQLLLYDIFFYCEVCEWEEITSRLPIGKKMIQRDIQDLTDAGLICIRYSKKERGYIKCGAPAFSDSVHGRRKMHLVRLNRLGKLMRELVCEDMSFEEKEVYREIYGEMPECKTAKESYQELFPDCSDRTMQRDFEELRRIGYRVEYSRDERYYMFDFPISLREDFGVYEKDGRLYIRGDLACRSRKIILKK